MLVIVAPEAVAAKPANVEVIDLRVNGLYDNPLLGLGDPSPILAWRMKATPSSNSHPCKRSGPKVACPADEQTAYQIQAANSVSGLNAGNLIWDSGKVAGDAQSGVAVRRRRTELPRAGRVAGARLGRQRRAVRVERARRLGDGAPGPERLGRRPLDRLSRTDRGPAACRSSPAQFDLQGNVAKARLHVSGLGLHKATVNGQELTDEALAPGYSNFQLSAEYRTYDVTDELVGGSNTVGVQLGNGTAYVRRSVTNPAVGRTAPYSWWQSQLKGSGVLTEAAAAGATNVKPSSTANYHLGRHGQRRHRGRRRAARVTGHHQHRHGSDDGGRAERHHRHTRAGR